MGDGSIILVFERGMEGGGGGREGFRLRESSKNRYILFVVTSIDTEENTCLVSSAGRAHDS